MTTPPRPDWAADDPWTRAHTIPEPRPDWKAWAAGAAIALALIGAGYIAGKLTCHNTIAQAKTCMEGCK